MRVFKLAEGCGLLVGVLFFLKRPGPKAYPILTYAIDFSAHTITHEILPLFSGMGDSGGSLVYILGMTVHVDL